MASILSILMSVIMTFFGAFATIFPELVPGYDGLPAAAAPQTVPSYPAGTELLTLVQDGVSGYTIVHGQNAHRSEKRAAAELASYLFEITGVTLPTVADDAQPTEKEIIVGKTNRAADALVDRAALGDDGYCIRVSGSKLMIAGGEARGTLYGVYGFLEDFLGCRWFTPTDELVPQQTALALPRDTNVSSKPAFSFRHTSWVRAQDTSWRSKMHFNGTMSPGHGSMDNSQQDLILFGGYDAGHTFRFFVPKETYFATNPEYFAMDENGKRVDGQCCLSNPAVLELTKAYLDRWLTEYPNANIFSVSQNDNQNYCHCAQCAAIDKAEGSPAGSLLTFVNKIADYVKTKRPDVLIHTFAYQYTVTPPKTLRPADNVLIQLCSIDNNHAEPYRISEPQFCEDVKTWSAISKHLIVWDYGTNFGHYLTPMPDLRILQPNAQMYYENGAQGYFMQANSMSISGEFAELRAYLIGKLMWDPYCNLAKAQDEFLYYYYGPGYQNIKAYIDLIEAKRSSKFKLFADPGEAVWLTVFDLAKATAYFDSCQKLAATAQQAQNTERSALQLRYYKSEMMKAEFFPYEGTREEAGRQFYHDMKRLGITHLHEGTPLTDTPDFRNLASSWSNPR